MLLLFLLAFNSSTNLGHDDYFIREQTTQLVKTLDIVAWPSLILTEQSDNPEAVHRAYPLLARVRYLRRLSIAREFLTDGWPVTVAQAKYIFDDERLWRAIYEVATELTTDATSLYDLNPLTFNQWENSAVDWTYLQRRLSRFKNDYGAKFSWILPQ